MEDLQDWFPAEARNDGSPALPLWIAGQVRNDVMWDAPRCGYCLEASMTATLLHPVDSRLRGNDG